MSGTAGPRELFSLREAVSLGLIAEGGVYGRGCGGGLTLKLNGMKHGSFMTRNLCACAEDKFTRLHRSVATASKV